VGAGFINNSYKYLVVVNFVIEPENPKPSIGNRESGALSNTNNAARSLSYTERKNGKWNELPGY